MSLRFGIFGIGYALLTLPVAHAAVYHCVSGGRQVYTDIPCTPESQPAQLPRINRADPATDSGGLARQFDHDAAHVHQRRDHDNAAWLEMYRAKKARDAAIRKGLVEGRVVEGMTPAEVERVLGVPASTLGSKTAPRRWSYRNGRARKTVAFKNGRVSSISERSGKRR